MNIIFKAVTKLIDFEKENSYLHAALSAVEIFSNIGTKDGITKNILHASTRKHSKIKKRIEEENCLKLTNGNIINTCFS